MRAWWSKLRSVFERDEVDDDLRAELASHLEMEADANEDRGMRREDALAAARRAFGNTAHIRETSRDAWSFSTVESVLSDLRCGLRLLRRSPVFTVAAVAVIGLGIGGSTAAFTLLDHVLVRPLPFAQPERLVMLYETQPANGVPRTQTSPPNFADWRAASKSFDVMGAYISIPFAVNLSGKGEPQRLHAAIVNSDLVAALGVRPAAGRVFNAEDDRVGGADVVLIGEALARTLFGGAHDAIGQTISLDNQVRTIVGVMPIGFAFPSRAVDVWSPLRFSPGMMASRSNHLLYAVARRRPGVSIDAARAEMKVIGEALQRAYPTDNARTEIGVAPLRGMLSMQSRTLVVAMFGGAFCLLLIACTNLANLLLARAAARSQEIAVRIAIGAGRGRILRQLITETLVLGLAGGAIGLLLAVLATPLLSRLVPSVLPVGATPVVDWRVVAFAAAITVATCLAFGAAPAYRSCRAPDLGALRSGSRAGRRTGRLRSILVVAEVAGTVTLLVSVGLLLKALWRVQAVDPGFRADSVLTLRTALPAPKYSAAAARHRFYTGVLDSARALPGVVSAAYVSYQPMEFASGKMPVTAPGTIDDPLAAPSAIVHFITPRFFETLRIPILRGRDVEERDDEKAPRVAIVSESLAERLWPGRDPLGQRVDVGRAERTVIGVAGSIFVRGLEGARDPQIYFPSTQLGGMSIYYAPKDLLVRADGDPWVLAPALTKIVHEADPAQAVADVRLMGDILSSQTASRRDQAAALGAFAVLAFVLAAVGIHGLLTFTIAARTQEIGVRMALGASRARIRGMFLRQGVTLGIVGIAVAVPLSYAAARAMRSLLFGVDPADPAIYASAVFVAALMTAISSLYPAARASAIDPNLSLRAAD